MSDRFVIVNKENSFDVLKVDSGYLKLIESVLVDTQHPEGPRALGSDDLEPKDARFTRRLSWVPKLLNELASELERDRSEVQSLKAVIEFDKINNNKQHEEIMELRAKLQSERDHSRALNEWINLGARVIANQKQHLDKQEKLIQALYLELGSKNYQNE